MIGALASCVVIGADFTMNSEIQPRNCQDSAVGGHGRGLAGTVIVSVSHDEAVSNVICLAKEYKRSKLSSVRTGTPAFLGNRKKREMERKEGRKE